MAWAVVRGNEGLSMEYDLTILRRAADEACEMAITEPHRPAGAINWADL